MVESRSTLSLHREAEAKLQGLARHISNELPEGVGFTLLTFTYGEGGYAGYAAALRDELLEFAKTMDAARRHR